MNQEDGRGWMRILVVASLWVLEKDVLNIFDCFYKKNYFKDVITKLRRFLLKTPRKLIFILKHLQETVQRFVCNICPWKEITWHTIELRGAYIGKEFLNFADNPCVYGDRLFPHSRKKTHRVTRGFSVILMILDG